jgi:cytochrome P450
LASQPEIQEKLRAEIDEQIWNENNEISYDDVMNMKYMNLFVNEVLRMYPITVTGVARECSAPITICGHRIDEG